MSDGTWIDPWLKLREKTEVRNDLAEIADTYARMSRLAVKQLNRLKVRPRSTAGTIDGLASIILFCDERSKPLFEKLALIEAEIAEETERLNHD